MHVRVADNLLVRRHALYQSIYFHPLRASFLPNNIAVIKSVDQHTSTIGKVNVTTHKFEFIPFHSSSNGSSSTTLTSKTFLADFMNCASALRRFTHAK